LLLLLFLFSVYQKILNWRCDYHKQAIGISKLEEVMLRFR
jgi:hypothetical protein